MKSARSDPDRGFPDFEVFALDVGLLGLVPVGVLLVHFLASATTKSRLTHEIGSLTPLSAFGHAFVHFSFGGLLANLLGYVVLTAVGYGVAVSIGERRWFHLSLVTVVITVPIIAGIVDGFVFGSVSSGTTISIRGLSAVVAAIAGLLYVLYLGLLRRVYDPFAAVLGGCALAIALVAGFADGYATVPRSMVYALPLVAFGILGVEGMRRAEWSLRNVRMWTLRAAVPSGVVVTATLLAAAAGLFPADLHVGGSFTNVFGHAVGWITGAVVAGWGHRYWTGVSWA
ncbi:MAG: hypothetical protein ABEJ44_01060 [Halanaeroarchaeum sp.]